MALAHKLQLRQTQSLAMTPQLLQSIKLLQLAHGELERFVEEEVERNPLIRRASTEEQPEASTGAQPPGEDIDGQPDRTQWDEPLVSERVDAAPEDLYPDKTGTWEPLSANLAAQWKSVGGSRTSDGGGFDPATLAAAPTTLSDHIAEQIIFAFRDPAERLIARELAGELDESGYMRGDVNEIAHRLNAEPGAVATVLTVCQGFDPSGLFARDLRQCLALQLAARDRLDPAMAALLDNLDLLARRDFAALEGICGVGRQDLVDMLAEIRALDPRPGLAFDGALAEPIVPDVVIRARGDGSWGVELNPEALPRIIVDHSYVERVSAWVTSAEDKAFMSECMHNASWLVRSLDQRARTILAVACEIVRQQDAFLTHGIRHLRPLTLRAVADAVDMHESTISRVTSNKYMLTPRGVFELRYFFTASIASAEGGDAHSAEAVRDRIREMIAKERQAQILSDDAIVDILRKSGIDIARRTVAKYRESMKIPSSVRRRREKQALIAAAE